MKRPDRSSDLSKTKIIEDIFTKERILREEYKFILIKVYINPENDDSKYSEASTYVITCTINSYTTLPVHIPQKGSLAASVDAFKIYQFRNDAFETNFKI